MRFVIRMAVREIRASWRRLILFFLCIAVGVGGIVLLRSVVQNVRVAIARDARSMVAADVTMSTSRPWDEQVRATVERRLAAVQVLARAEGVETNTMVRPADERRAVTKMAEVRGVQPAFPLYGTVELEGGRPVLACAPEGPRCAREARAPCAAGVAGRRRDPHRDRPLHGSRRDCVGARTPGVGFQLRTRGSWSMPRTSRPRGSWDSAAAFRATFSSSCRSGPWRRSSRSSGTTSWEVRQRPVVPRNRGSCRGGPDRGRRTISASSGSSSSSWAASGCRA